jgi:hypothetical protein
LQITGTIEFSRKGEGLDNAVQYKSPDKAITATAYLFYPGLAHSGLSAWSTDNAIRRTSTSEVRVGDTRIAAAGGRDGVAVLRDYANYLGDNASSAAFIKAGRWIVAYRVSAPTARKAEVDAAMTALLAGTRFGSESPLYPAAPVTVTDCAPGTGKVAARVLPDPPGAELIGEGLIAAFDAGGEEMKDKQSDGTHFLPSRVPASFCLSARLAIGRNEVPVLRGAPGPGGVDGRTLLVAVLNDAGAYLEIVGSLKTKRFVLLSHDIGRSAMLGSFDGVPSDEQIRDIVEHPDQAVALPRVPVVFTPGKGARIFVPSPDKEAAPKT